MRVDAVIYPGQFAELKRCDLSKHIAVVFDVLRATSTELTALVNGADSVFPVQSLEEALERKRADPSVLLAGERNSFKPEGFDLGNSPLEFTPDRIRGRRIVHSTTNGTWALNSCAHAKAVYLGTLLNLSALAQALTLAPGPLTLVLAGRHSHFALEDGIAAGALIDKLPGAELAPSARACLSIWRSNVRDLRQGIAASKNAERLRSVGLGVDVDYCSQVDSTSRLARLEAGSLKLF